MFRLVICDLDNTLYDWLSYFVPSFYAMVDSVIKTTDWDREKLLDEFRMIHQKHHDSEHPFALLETESVLQMFQGKDPKISKEYFDSAFHAFNSMRKKELKTYREVHETLNALKEMDICLVAHTDAKLHACVDRLQRLDLTQYFDLIFCRKRADSDHPDGLSEKERLKGYPIEKITELPHERRKPDPNILKEICETMNVSPQETAYVGDSIAHDIMMANDAGIFSIFAKYGTKRDNDEWDKLVRVSHWTPEDVQREKELRETAENVKANFTANTISEILIPINRAN